MSRHHEHIKNDPRWKAARLVVLDECDHMCQLCGSDVDLEVDHVVPLAVLFAHGATAEAIEAAVDPGNLTVLCKPCNGRKGDRPADDPARAVYVRPDWAAVLTPLL